MVIPVTPVSSPTCSSEGVEMGLLGKLCGRFHGKLVRFIKACERSQDSEKITVFSYP